MRHASRVTTRFPVESDLDAGVVKRLSDMINAVYDEAESGMWKVVGSRTDPAAVERLLHVGALILAEIKEFLAACDARIGYAPQDTESLERMYTNLVPELATDCDFTVWHKSLVDMR